MTEDMERQLKRFDLKEAVLPEGVLPGEYLESMGRVVSDLTESIREMVNSIMENLSPTFSQLVECINRIQEERRMMEKTVELGLVSWRVVDLAYHKRGRVSKKNMNRIRKALALYEKRNPNS